MSLINPNDKSLAEIQAETVMEIRGQVAALWASMVSIYGHCMNVLWRNPNGLTPQQVCNAFGTKASELFMLAGMLANLLNTVAPNNCARSSIDL